MKTVQVIQTKHLGTSQANRNSFLFFKPKTSTVGLRNKKQQAAWCTLQCQCVPCSSWPSTIPPSTNMPLWRSAPMSQNRTLLFHKCYLGRTTTFPGTLTSREQMCTQLREPSTLSAIYCDFCPKKKKQREVFTESLLSAPSSASLREGLIREERHLDLRGKSKHQ